MAVLSSFASSCVEEDEEQIGLGGVISSSSPSSSAAADCSTAVLLEGPVLGFFTFLKRLIKVWIR